MFKVIEKESGHVIEYFKRKEDACHFTFLLAVQDRKDGCYTQGAYIVTDSINNVVHTR